MTDQDYTNDEHAEFARDCARVCGELRDMLIAKNKAYGNSALNPQRVFSRAGPEEQIRVRMDDKLSRIRNAQATGTADIEDAERDLAGYLVLLLIAKERAAK